MSDDSIIWKKSTSLTPNFTFIESVELPSFFTYINNPQISPALPDIKSFEEIRNKLREGPVVKENHEFSTIIHPGKLDNLVLDDQISLVVDEWLLELKTNKEILRKYAIEPRRSILFFGQPGCGKTSLAKNIATKLDRPISIMKLSSVENKYVGESEKSLTKLFEHATQNNMVLFIDEIDCFACDRDDKAGSSHSRNMTIALLNEIDNFEGILIGATNRHEAIDDAIWRRFDVHMEIPAPNSKAIQQIIRNCFLPFDVSELEAANLAAVLDGIGASLVKQLVACIKRTMVLSEHNNLPADIETVLNKVANSILPPPLKMNVLSGILKHVKIFSVK